MNTDKNLVLELIPRGESLYQVLDTLLRVIQLQCPGMLASILLLDPDGSHVRHGAAPDLPEDYVRAIDGLPIGPQAGSCGTAAFTRKPVIVGDIATDPLWNDYRAVALENDLRACWSTPIFDSERRVLGTFAMYFRAPGLPNQSHLKIASAARTLTDPGVSGSISVHSRVVAAAEVPAGAVPPLVCTPLGELPGKPSRTPEASAISTTCSELRQWIAPLLRGCAESAKRRLPLLLPPEFAAAAFI